VSLAIRSLTISKSASSSARSHSRTSSIGTTAATSRPRLVTTVTSWLYVARSRTCPRLSRSSRTDAVFASRRGDVASA
jgi:hypothetical protein